MALDDMMPQQQPPVDNSYMEFDELMKEYALETQENAKYHAHEMPTEAGPGIEATQPVSGFMPQMESSSSIFSKRTEPIDPEKAARSGMRLAKMLDGAISTGAAMFIAKTDDTSRYKASEGDVKDVADALSEVTAEYNLDISPWFQVAFIVGIVYMPILTKAFNDKRINELEKQMQSMTKRVENIESQYHNGKTEEKPDSNGYGTEKTS